MKKGIDYIGVGVGAVIFNNEGKVFLAKRGEEARNERGKWEFPGGNVEFGETIKDAIVREMREEFDIQIEPLELLGVCDHFIPEEKQHWVSPGFICKIVSGKPAIMEPDKITEFGWFDLSQADTLPLSIVTKMKLDMLKNKYPDKF